MRVNLLSWWGADQLYLEWTAKYSVHVSHCLRYSISHCQGYSVTGLSW